MSSQHFKTNRKIDDVSRRLSEKAIDKLNFSVEAINNDAN